jgi:hypothetical protein
MKKKKYLLRKKSGSRSHYKWSFGDYDRAEHRGEFKEENYPKTESMVTKDKNGLDTSLIKKWLYSQVGKHFDTIYTEYLERVQPKYLETHKDKLFWYATKAEFIILDGDKVFEKSDYNGSIFEVRKGFYFHPDTNILCRVGIKIKPKEGTKKDRMKKYYEHKKNVRKSKIQWKKNQKLRGDQLQEKLKEKKESSNV